MGNHTIEERLQNLENTKRDIIKGICKEITTNSGENKIVQLVQWAGEARNLSIENGGVLIGKGVKYVKVSANLRCSSNKANTRVSAQIMQRKAIDNSDIIVASNPFIVNADNTYGMRNWRNIDNGK